MGANRKDRDRSKSLELPLYIVLTFGKCKYHVWHGNGKISVIFDTNMGWKAEWWLLLVPGNEGEALKRLMPIALYLSLAFPIKCISFFSFPLNLFLNCYFLSFIHTKNHFFLSHLCSPFDKRGK